MSATIEQADDKPAFRMREQNFDRVMRILNAKIEGADPWFSAPALARKYLFCERAARDVPDDEIRTAIQECGSRHVAGLMEATPRTFADVALKLAVAIAAEPADCGSGMTSDQYGLLTAALAEMVILGDRELPDVRSLKTLTAADLEWHKPGEGEAQS